MTQSRVETWMRAVGFLLALAVASYLAIVQGSTEAAGALLALLGLAASYLFRGRVEKAP